MSIKNFDPFGKKPFLTRSIMPCIDFPSYTGSVIIASVLAARRIASLVSLLGTPYVDMHNRDL